MYGLNSEPVMLSATAGSTTMIVSYSSASGNTASVSPELDDPTRKSTSSSSNNFVAFCTATSGLVSVSSMMNSIFFPATSIVPSVAYSNPNSKPRVVCLPYDSSAPVMEASTPILIVPPSPPSLPSLSPLVSAVLSLESASVSLPPDESLHATMNINRKMSISKNDSLLNTTFPPLFSL